MSEWMYTREKGFANTFSVVVVAPDSRKINDGRMKHQHSLVIWQTVQKRERPL